MKSSITIGMIMLMGIVMLILALGFIIYSYDKADGDVKILNDDNFEEIENYGGDTNMEYQGPVPIGYDLEHFRKTGETIKEVEN